MPGESDLNESVVLSVAISSPVFLWAHSLFLPKVAIYVLEAGSEDTVYDTTYRDLRLGRIARVEVMSLRIRTP